MPVQSPFLPSAAFEAAASRRIRPEPERRASSQDFTLPAAPPRDADASLRRAGDERRELRQATRTDQREAAQDRRSDRSDNAETARRAESSAAARADDAARQEPTTTASGGREPVRNDRDDAGLAGPGADERQAGATKAGETEADAPGAPAGKADVRETKAGAASLDTPEPAQPQTSQAATAGQAPKPTPAAVAAAVMAGEQAAGVLAGLQAVQQFAARPGAGKSEGREPDAQEGEAGSAGTDTAAATSEYPANPAAAGQPAAMLTETTGNQPAAAAGQPEAGQPAVSNGTEQGVPAPVYAALPLPAATPAPVMAAQAAAVQAQGDAGAVAPTGDALRGKAAVKQGWAGSVAHIARQEQADASEGTEAVPFGALVSALAKNRDAPADAAQAVAAGATGTQDIKAFEPAPAPLQPIDLGFLSQMRQPKADGLLVSVPAEHSAATGQASAHTGSEGPATPLHVVPIEIGLRALAGGRKFDIRLDPGELGRVDVNLEISDAGEVTAKLVVDRVETLQLLQRDARTLERAFEQAGLKPSDGGVNITLRDPADQSGFRQNRDQDGSPRRGRSRNDTIDEIAAPVEAAGTRRLIRLGGVDLSI